MQGKELVFRRLEIENSQTTIAGGVGGGVQESGVENPNST